MALVKKEQKPVLIDYQCDTCNKGWYRPTGTALLSLPAKYPHKCTECGVEIILDDIYPMLTYVDADAVVD